MPVTIHTHCLLVPVKYFTYLSALLTSGRIHCIYWLTSLYFDRSIKVAGFRKGILPVAPFLTAQVTGACSIYVKQKHPGF